MVVDIVQDGEYLAKDPFLSYRCQGVQLSTNYRSSLPHQFVKPCGIPPLNVASPAHHSIEENAGDDSLIEHLQRLLADVKRPQPPQDVKSGLSGHQTQTPSTGMDRDDSTFGRPS